MALLTLYINNNTFNRYSFKHHNIRGNILVPYSINPQFTKCLDGILPTFGIG